MNCPICDGALNDDEAKYGGHFEDRQCIAALRASLEQERKRADEAAKELLEFGQRINKIAADREALRDKLAACDRELSEARRDLAIARGKLTQYRRFKCE